MARAERNAVEASMVWRRAREAAAIMLLLLVAAVVSVLGSVVS
jgi:hypothetical protein